eukprot:GHUV01024995.1.p3 GENE.GHUV01024995.1~~GHUV01024995.1.p3  ORF type:complete len:104 (+),score=12.93 GHUV01024995.1:782-1093(+)
MKDPVSIHLCCIKLHVEPQALRCKLPVNVSYRLITATESCIDFSRCSAKWWWPVQQVRPLSAPQLQLGYTAGELATFSRTYWKAGRPCLLQQLKPLHYNNIIK